uniref:Tubulin--tyrosine ligase n=1 Tax=viral metagenome TaxID=1070528 RepID=A0A6C0AXA3_9ZZZZ
MSKNLIMSMKKFSKEENQKKTFMINRSNILKDILLDKGWIEGGASIINDFTMWDPYLSKVVNGNIMLLPRQKIRSIDIKSSFFKKLFMNNINCFYPKTFFHIENVNIKENKLYFLKNSYSTDGKHVYCINSENKDFISTIQKPKEYILQENVENIYLLNNRKTVIRVYMIYINNKLYLYTDGNMVLMNDIYDETNTNIHVNIQNHYECHNLSSLKNYNIIIKNIESQMREVAKVFNSDLYYKEDNKDIFHIFGFDYILNTNLNPYVIEVNGYPSLFKDTRENFNKLKKHLLENMYEILINKKPVDNKYFVFLTECFEK